MLESRYHSISFLEKHHTGSNFICRESQHYSSLKRFRRKTSLIVLWKQKQMQVSLLDFLNHSLQLSQPLYVYSRKNFTPEFVNDSRLCFRIAHKGISYKKLFFQEVELFPSPHLFHFMKFSVSLTSPDNLLMAITEVRVITSAWSKRYH